MLQKCAALLAVDPEQPILLKINRNDEEKKSGKKAVAHVAV